MLIATNSLPLAARTPRFPRGLGYVRARRPYLLRGRGLGYLGAAAATPTVQALLSSTGHGSEYKQFCDCSSSKFCSPSAAGCPTNQYALCSYWGASVAARMLCWPPPSPWVLGVSSSVAQSANLAAGAVGTAVGAATMGLIGGAAVLGPAALAAAPIAAIVGIFTSHHAQAQAAQANAIASTVPVANAALQQMDAMLASGQMMAAQASQALDQLQSKVTSAMKQGTSYKHGDALWCVDIAMQLVVAARKQDLQAGVGTSGTPLPSAASSTAGGAAPSASSSNLLPVLAVSGALLAAWMLL